MSVPPTSTDPEVGSIRRSTARPAVVLPQPDSPTRPSVSPTPMVKLTPSTAWTWPTVRRSRPLRTGKCFLRSWTARTGWFALTIAVPAGGPVAAAFLFVDRPLAAADIVGAIAARCKGAALGQLEQGRHDAGDFLQPCVVAYRLAPHQVEPGDRGEQADRVGVQRPAEQFADLGFLDLAAGIHDDDALRGLGNHAEIV